MIRLEHDVKGRHRSTFHDDEAIGSAARTILMADVMAIVVIQKDQEKRFILADTAVDEPKKSEHSG